MAAGSRRSGGLCLARRRLASRRVRVALAGVVIGAIAAVAAGRWIGPLLFRQSPRDPMVFALVGLVLVGVAVIASGIPALRAARVDPRTALLAD